MSNTTIKPKKKKQPITKGQIILNLIFIVLCATYIIPMILLVSISISSESAITQYGYTILPKEVGFDGYKMVFKNPGQLIQSYKVTIIYSLASTFLSLIVMALYAYPLSRRNYSLRKISTWYVFFTMLFSGGLVPSYIINTRWLHLGNSIWIYIFPGLVTAWNVIIMRTFFQGLPDGLVEAAKIDGASEFLVFCRIIIPLSTPVLASLGFMHLIGAWNNWNTSLIYIHDKDLYSLQYLLQRILREADFIKQMAEQGQEVGAEAPIETMRYAMAILAAGPMMVVFPFFQKYFAKGLTIGSVKG